VPSARDVSIVIPSWNGRRLLEEFLPSVIEAAARFAREASAAVEIVVVDDGSTDETVAWVTDQIADCRVPLRTIRHDTNLGFGEACNRGVRAAAHGLIFLLNNDIDVDRDALAPLVARFRAEGDRALFAVHCRVRDFVTDHDVGTGKLGGFARGFLRVHRSYITREPTTGPLDSMFASGGSMMLDRVTFIELGGFDPLFAPFYLEDVELSYRAWKRGFTVGYEPRSVVRHRFSSTIGPSAGRRVPRISQRNRLIVHWIHLHDRRLLVSHVFWVLILVVAEPLALRPYFVGSVLDALGRLRTIRARRRDERRRARRSDREVLAIFQALETRRDIRAYDDPAELRD
jgi:GT2 family glycosyltransferase